MSVAGRVDFETRYREDPDPWGYETSAYERDKYAATLAACGPGPFTRALELGGSIGVFSALLAPRCRTLLTVDLAPTAVAVARERLAGLPQVRVAEGAVPETMPRGPFDLVVASEVLYYLEPAAFARTLARLRKSLFAGGRLVAVHWRPAGPERPLSAGDVHAALCDQPWLRRVEAADTHDYLLDVFERR